MVQDAIAHLVIVAPCLDDDLEPAQLDRAEELIGRITQPLSSDDIDALLALLPPSGDTAYGLNWTLVHTLEAAPAWPVWEPLAITGNEWFEILLTRLTNGGYVMPAISARDSAGS